MVFALAQFFLSEALSGRDDALSKLNRQVDELARMLDLERSANTELRLSVSQLSAQLQNSISDRESLTDRLSFMESLLKSARQENTDQLESLRAQASADQETIESQSRDLARLEADIAAREARLAELTERAETAETSFLEQSEISRQAQDQVALLNLQLAALRNQLAALNEALEASEAKNEEQNVQIVNLGKRLNEALATKVQELARYRSEFFGRLRDVLGAQKGVRIVGDRFVFQSEVLFSKGAADIGEAGKNQLLQLARTLQEISRKIPADLDWVLRVDGHTDKDPIKTARFPSNWELSASRAAEVARKLVTAGFPPAQLSIEAFAQYRPKVPNDSRQGRATNRRIEIVYQRGSIRKHMVDILRR